ncbi:hypothetical protein [Rathayibacter rathayi]|uniref:Uncharacterized protein n=1 Tax=Rathayibacter rathayi TaxID=33887 RepID=A0ABD6W6B8_RATRA|nr:hypothetical protein [Rathayibacter rathayi]MWV75849.1 hypothetical protein [Rathayibacter rathayi NCPPB 2980 = VKM Ac-1601]PPF11938.1 hypothetical protein C5C04_11410 [Rathayibacter rathayi]PPF45176.1 hypothetical protein C5C08_12540 [Rathayibacter rathayi]PPF77715.1 hypothetical protein C5C14_12100 [Rathayibacter rathayi]PPG11554.1 hypothetical protein C5C11_12105 [Rathayibacter rathayi]
MRPSTWKPGAENTLWLDLETGHGQTSSGIPLTVTPGARRKSLALADVLQTAAYHGIARVMLLKEPKKTAARASWWERPGKGWSISNFAKETPFAKYHHAETDTLTDVRTIAEWFGGKVAPTPDQARIIWDELEKLIGSAFAGGGLFNTPSATGKHLWAVSLDPKNADIPTLSADIIEEIHETAGQAYKEHFVAGPSFVDAPGCRPLVDPQKQPEIPNFAEIDGRVMYAAMCKELGTGPATRVKADTARELLGDERGIYRPARYYVRATVPDSWTGPGILATKDPDSSSNWLHPNVPGYTFQTWSDNSEVDLAIRMGWWIEPLEGIILTKARPLDRFSERITRLYKKVEANQDYDSITRTALRAALRGIILQAIGGFASTGSKQTVTVSSIMEVPAEYRPNVIPTGSGQFQYKAVPEMSDYQRGFYHPEFSAQIWARARVRVLDTVSALTDPSTRGPRAGALHVPPSELLGIQGDALFLGCAKSPRWSRPAREGGGDDGEFGRLRMKTALRGPLPTPIDLTARSALHARAAAEGWSAP